MPQKNFLTEKPFSLTTKVVRSYETYKCVSIMFLAYLLHFINFMLVHHHTILSCLFFPS